MRVFYGVQDTKDFFRFRDLREPIGSMLVEEQFSKLFNSEESKQENVKYGHLEC